VGVRFTDNITTGFSQDIATDRLIDLQPFEARIGDERYAPLPFADAVAGLVQLVSELSWDWHQSIAPEPGPAPSGETTLRQQDLWHTLQSFLRPGDIVLAEQGTAFYGASTLRLPTGVTFIGQPLWASIGYTLPAAFGAQTAAPDRRVLLLIGDGSALMTAQEIGSMIRDDQHPIIVVINNDGYTFERTIHGTDERYNDIARWDWQLLPEAMGGGDRTIARRASTPAEFTEALAAAADTDRLVLVEAVVPTLDVPELLAEVSRSIAAANAAD
jgi:indolepyruvate decarboxylase